MDELAAIAEALRKAREVLIVTHLAADGDCLGSMLAAYMSLKRLGDSRVRAVHPEPVPPAMRFLKGWEEISPPGSLSVRPEVVLVLDCTGLDRLGEEVAALVKDAPLIINMDHHAGNHHFGHINYVRPEAAATAELVLRLLDEMQSPLTPEVAMALYTGVVTDTGCFQYENTSSFTHEIAARFLDAGVAPAEVHRRLWEEKPPVTLRLLGKVLPTLTLTADGRVAWILATRAVLEEVGAGQEHCEGMVEYPRSLAEVEVALFFREVAANEVKVAFRSKRYVDVNALAARFGGGGHPRASGCTVGLPLTQAVPLVVQAAVAALAGETV